MVGIRQFISVLNRSFRSKAKREASIRSDPAAHVHILWANKQDLSSFSLCRSHSHTHTHSLSLSLLVVYTNTYYTHTCTLSLNLTHTRTHAHHRLRAFFRHDPLLPDL